MLDHDLRNLGGRLLRALLAIAVGVTVTRLVHGALYGRGACHGLLRRYAPRTEAADNGLLIPLWLGGFSAIATYLVLAWWEGRRRRARAALETMPRAELRARRPERT